MSSKSIKTVSEIIQDIEETYRCASHTIDRHKILTDIENTLRGLKASTVQELQDNLGKLSK